MSTSTRNVLVMEFIDAGGKSRSIRVADPKENLTTEVVEAAMETINTLAPFKAIYQFGPAKIKGAKTVQTVTNDLGITVN